MSVESELKKAAKEFLQDRPVVNDAVVREFAKRESISFVQAKHAILRASGTQTPEEDE